MSVPSPTDLPRIFAAAWGAQDARALAALFTPDADLISLTGGFAESRGEVEALFAGEFAGAFSRAKLSSGKTKIRSLGPHVAVVIQKVTISGLINAHGQDAGRIGALLACTMAEAQSGWFIVSAQFVVEP